MKSFIDHEAQRKEVNEYALEWLTEFKKDIQIFLGRTDEVLYSQVLKDSFSVVDMQGDPWSGNEKHHHETIDHREIVVAIQFSDPKD